MMYKQTIDNIKTSLLLILICTCLVCAYPPDDSPSHKIHHLSKYVVENHDAAKQCFEGFAEVIEGDRIAYHSSDPDVKDALIARASDGTSFVRWKTGSLPANFNNETVTFMWLAGTGCNAGEFDFDLKIDGEYCLTFSTRYSKDWSVEGQKGSSLRFKALSRDIHGDLFGYMFLTVPLDQIENYKETQIEVRGQNAGSSAWYMTFMHDAVVKDFIQAGAKGFWYRLDFDEEKGMMRILLPRTYAGKSLIVKDYKNRSFQSIPVLQEHDAVAVIRPKKMDLEWPVELWTGDFRMDTLTIPGGEGDTYKKTKDDGVIYRSWFRNENQVTVETSKNYFIEIPEHRLPWPENVQEFPGLTQSENGRMWLAVVERSGNERALAVYRIRASAAPEKICSLNPEGMSGIGVPAIAGYGNGCVIAFPVEKDNKWSIAYAFVDEHTSDKADIDFLEGGGTSNISPSVAVSGERVYIVWESNAGGKRSIFASNGDISGFGTPVRISSGAFNSYNPDIVVVGKDKVFAAWDSYHNHSADIWGAACHDGNWHPEARMTSDPRIERHPELAVRNGVVWMAWQAQSYGNTERDGQTKRIALNHVDEQRIVVAQIDRDGLESPVGLFYEISTDSRMLLRPEITFSPLGNLVLTARESLNKNDGWQPVIWTYSAAGWSEKVVLKDHRGRWYPVPVVCSSDSIYTAVQFDIRPKSGSENSRDIDWPSAVKIQAIKGTASIEGHPMETEKLNMPGTDFSLEDRSNIVASNFPRQKVVHNDINLQLYFGDFHEHTDISICARESNPPGHDLFANLRDIEQLDFCALTDHHIDIDRAVWQFNGEQTRNNHDPGRFVTFLGQEWSSSAGPVSFGYGHHNFIFLDPYFDKYINHSENYVTPVQLWERLKAVDYICIPHQLADWGGLARAKGRWGNPPKDWHYTDERLQPVAEIFQVRGSYEYFGSPRQSEDGAPLSRYYLQDAWKRKIIIGVIASPDHGGGYGKAGVWAEELTRESIFRAVQARHTFGTSGQKMSLLFTSGNNLMGDKVARPAGHIPFQIKAKAVAGIKEVVIFRNNEIVYQTEPNRTEIHVEWIDENPLDEDFVWYYARIMTVDDELAWSSPIWFLDEEKEIKN